MDFIVVIIIFPKFLNFIIITIEIVITIKITITNSIAITATAAIINKKQLL